MKQGRLGDALNAYQHVKTLNPGYPGIDASLEKVTRPILAAPANFGSRV